MNNLCTGFFALGICVYAHLTHIEITKRKESVMKKTKKAASKCIAIVMSSAMVLSMPYIAGLQMSAQAAQKINRDDNSIVYAVDCGDLDVTTTPDDGPLGTHNSVTDQVYGADAQTGYKWGIVDSVSSPLTNGSCSIGGVSTDWTWPYEFVSGDQSKKTATNRYTKNQFETSTTISANQARHIDYKFEVENGEYYVEVGFTDPWGCSKTPSVYANIGKDDATEIAKDFDVSTNSGVVTGTVKVTDGELTINARGTGDDNKAINMTYITIKEAGDTTLAQTDLDAISIPETVSGDIELPSKGSLADSEITWSSSNESVISKDGKVTRPAAGESDAEVTLTAAVKNGNVTLTKDFKVTVTAKKDMTDLEYFDSEKVEVTDEYYQNALELDVENMLKLDADRLLAGFRETAGYAAGMSASEIKEYMKNKERYGGNWENSLIGGHILGHYMSAAAQGIVNPGVTAEQKEKLTERLNYIIDSLADCQKKTEGVTGIEGYIFGATLPSSEFKKNVVLQFDNVESGKTNISTQAWVPWYTMHKILAGLTDAYEVAGNKTALEVANKLGTWIANRANGWSSSTQSTVLGIEYGGMNDALYQLYKVTDASNKEDFYSAAHKFDETSLFEGVLKGTDNILNNKHANTTIPKFLGALCRYETDDTQTKYLQYAESFWQMVIDKHTYVTGGNSEDEHFGADNVLDGERTVCNNETCNTYNMLKLSRRLFVITGDKKYADYYETTLINAIMSSQDHKTGLTMYFQPMASGYQKVFGTLENSFWCCTGSGMENFTKLQDSIYFKGKNVIAVNQYLASKATGDGYVIEQKGDLSKSDTMTFKVSGDSITFNLKLRMPYWVKDGKATVKFGDEEYDYEVKDGYIVIPNEKISQGAEFGIKLPMEVKAYNLADGKDTYAFKYGPYVLSAKLGKSKQSTTSHGVSVTVPSAKAVANDTIGITNADSVDEFIANINENLVKQDGTMNFTLSGTNVDYVFTTHYNQDEENYGIYWTYYVDADGRSSQAVLDEKQKNRIEDATIDKIEQLGRGQYELRFTLADGKETVDGLIDNGSVAEDAPNLARYAQASGSFTYKMIADESEDNYLLVTYAKEDDGKPIKITVGESVIADEILDSTKAEVKNITLANADREDYYQVMYKIPADVVKDNISELKVIENEQEVTKKVINITFSGGDKESARVCKSLSLMRAFRNTNTLTSVEYNEQTLTPDKEGKIEINTTYDKVPEVKFNISDKGGYVMAGSDIVDETENKKIKTNGKVTEVKIKVYAQDFETVSEYTLVVNTDYTGLDLSANLVKAFGFENNIDGAKAVSKALVPAVISGKTYTYTDGNTNKALSMDGTYGLKLLDDASKLGESYTISFAIKPSEVGNKYNPTLTAGTFSPEYWLNLTLDGKIWTHDSAGYIETTVSNAYTAGEWQTVTLTVDGTKQGTKDGTISGKLYVNGEIVSEGNVAKDIMKKSGAAVYFGVNAWDAYFNGGLDDVLLFDKALTQSEVSALGCNVINADTVKKAKETASPSPSPVTGDDTKQPETPATGTEQPDVKATDTPSPAETSKAPQQTTSEPQQTEQATAAPTKTPDNNGSDNNNNTTTKPTNEPTAAPTVKPTTKPTVNPTKTPATTKKPTVKVKKKKMSVKKVIAKRNTKKITGVLSVSGTKVMVKVGSAKNKKAKVKGKKFTFKVSKKLKRKTKIVITVTKSKYYKVKKTVKVK